MANLWNDDKNEKSIDTNYKSEIIKTNEVCLLKQFKNCVESECTNISVIYLRTIHFS